jgi:glycosyltransferase involved in cell wall biosynthesis/SAM-dependent methyltransferase
MTFRLHLITMPHVQVNRYWNACAYTQKDVKLVSMLYPRGHEIIVYANEGSKLEDDDIEIVQALTEKERASFFGSLDRQKLIDLKWDANEPYWRLFFERVIGPLKARVRKGDFILSLSGCCHQPIAECFPGSYKDTPQTAMWVEYGTGYYGTFSRYVVAESSSHREWLHGKKNSTYENNDDAVIPNYFDVRDFPIVERPANLGGVNLSEPNLGGVNLSEPNLGGVDLSEPYFLFLGRVISSKGTDIAVDTIKDIPGARLIVAGQGDEYPRHERVIRFGHATIEERNILMQHAIAVLNPTRFREPFGGTAVEAQIAGTPAITTDHGAFCETVEDRWRCASHRDFVEAAKAAMGLGSAERAVIRARAIGKWSLEAVAPRYEHYFQRLFDRWGDGWYQRTPLAALPSAAVSPATPVELQDFARITVEELPQAKRIAQYFRDRPGVDGTTRFLDVGCGPGIYVTEMRALGVTAFGVDNDERLPDGRWFEKVDVTSSRGEATFSFADIVLSLEVGEHIPGEKADDYINYLSRTGASVVYFSAARPGQGGIGHVNLQPKSYWVEKFHKVGFYVDVDETDAWISFMRSGDHMGWLVQNGMVLQRSVNRTEPINV